MTDRELLIQEAVEHIRRHKTNRDKLTTKGEEIINPRPMAPPIGYKKQPSMVEIVQNMIKSERLKQLAIDNGLETLEEADDFDTGEDDFDPSSPWEGEFEPLADVRGRFETDRAQRHQEELRYTEAEVSRRSNLGNDYRQLSDPRHDREDDYPRTREREPARHREDHSTDTPRRANYRNQEDPTPNRPVGPPQRTR